MITHFSITQRGRRHKEAGTECQDFSVTRSLSANGCDYVVAAVADGVGSCDFSACGAQVAVESAVGFVEESLASGAGDLACATVTGVLQRAFESALDAVECRAEIDELPFVLFDSTLTVAVFDGSTVWYGHVGDDGLVVMGRDGTCRLATTRHKGEDANQLYPLRFSSKWEFGTVGDVASFALMTDGVLDYCVDDERMGNRVYLPFLYPLLYVPLLSPADAQDCRLTWDEYLAIEAVDDGGTNGAGVPCVRDTVGDDITIAVVQNPESVRDLPGYSFDLAKWREDTERRSEEVVRSLRKAALDRLAIAGRVREKERGQRGLSPSCDDETGMRGEGQTNRCEASEPPMVDDGLGVGMMGDATPLSSAHRPGEAVQSPCERGRNDQEGRVRQTHGERAKHARTRSGEGKGHANGPLDERRSHGMSKGALADAIVVAGGPLDKSMGFGKPVGELLRMIMPGAANAKHSIGRDVDANPEVRETHAPTSGSDDDTGVEKGE